MASHDRARSGLSDVRSPSVSIDLSVEPRARSDPIPLYCARRDPQRLGNLILVEPSEKPKLNYTAQTRTLSRQLLERVVERDKLINGHAWIGNGKIERNRCFTLPALSCTAAPRVIDENLPHRASGD